MILGKKQLFYSIIQSEEIKYIRIMTNREKRTQVSGKDTEITVPK